MSGADGIGDTEGKAATGSGERAGRQASFKFVSQILWRLADYPPFATCEGLPPSAGKAPANKTARHARDCATKKDTASEVAGRRVSNV